MHFVHAILVKLKEKDVEKLNNGDLRCKARDIAMKETESYGDGNVFDWRTDEDAGRWSGQYPGDGVILGKEDKDKFMSELKIWSEKPLKEALTQLKYAGASRTKWRTEKEIQEDKEFGVVKLKQPKEFYGKIDSEGNPINNEGERIYYSGKKVVLPKINEKLLKTIWSSHTNPDDAKHDGVHLRYSVAYPMYKALKLVLGYYDSSSHFYSVPDWSSAISVGTMEEIQESPELFALVFSDYHN